VSEALLHLLDQVERSAGATVLLGGNRIDGVQEPLWSLLTDLNPEILHITKNYSDLFPHFTGKDEAAAIVL
jgi:hypothetical protein